MSDDKLYESMARDHDAYPKGPTMTNETKTNRPDLAERILGAVHNALANGSTMYGPVRTIAIPIEEVLDKAKRTAVEAIGMNDSLVAENERLKAEFAELRGKNRVVCDPPDRCPITGLPFFMIIEDEDGNALPTYGGPYDSYTIPERDNEGNFIRRRYDHDEGGWVDEWENVCMKVMDEDDYLKMEDELAELRAFAERFPKTADGVLIVPGMRVCLIDGDVDTVSCVSIDITGDYDVWLTDNAGPYGSSELYSTKAAMLAAKEEGLRP